MPAGMSARAAHREPVLNRNVALGDRHQTSKPAFAGQQVVMAGVLDGSADGYPTPNSRRSWS